MGNKLKIGDLVRFSPPLTVCGSIIAVVVKEETFDIAFVDVEDSQKRVWWWSKETLTKGAKGCKKLI